MGNMKGGHKGTPLLQTKPFIKLHFNFKENGVGATLVVALNNLVAINNTDDVLQNIGVDGEDEGRPQGHAPTADQTVY